MHWNAKLDTLVDKLSIDNAAFSALSLSKDEVYASSLLNDDMSFDMTNASLLGSRIKLTSSHLMLDTILSLFNIR